MNNKFAALCLIIGILLLTVGFIKDVHAIAVNSDHSSREDQVIRNGHIVPEPEILTMVVLLLLV